MNRQRPRPTASNSSWYPRRSTPRRARAWEIGLAKSFRPRPIVIVVVRHRPERQPSARPHGGALASQAREEFGLDVGHGTMNRPGAQYVIEAGRELLEAEQTIGFAAIERVKQSHLSSAVGPVLGAVRRRRPRAAPRRPGRGGEPERAQPRACTPRRRVIYNPRSRAMIMRWTSEVPSPISRILESRQNRATGYSFMKP